MNVLERVVRHARVSWKNLAIAGPPSPPFLILFMTSLCNLACEHCYLDAGGTPLVGTENFADRSELRTDLDVAIALVQNAVNSALPQLPQQVRSQGVNVKKK